MKYIYSIQTNNELLHKENISVIKPGNEGTTEQKEVRLIYNEKSPRIKN